MKTIKLTSRPVHIVQYRNSPHAYGCTFATRATTTAGIAKAAARAAREDLAYWSNNRDAAPVVTSIDFVALLPRDWEDPEMWRLTDMIDREANKQRPPKMHESAEHPSKYF
jgi:hypothetical protein